MRKSRLKSRPVKRYEKSFGSNGGECLAKDCVGGAQVYEMIELIHTRHSERDGHAMDVLMEALRKQRVQAHIARELQRALARAKDQRRGIYTHKLLLLNLESFGDVFPLQEMGHLVQCLPNLTPQLSPHVR